MIAFEVLVNGKKRCLAGVAKVGVASVNLYWVKREPLVRGLPKEELRLSVGGLDSLKSQNLDWLAEDLNCGDEVLIRVKKMGKVDAPLKVRPVDKSVRPKKAYVRRMAKEFGWKIVTK